MLAMIKRHFTTPSQLDLVGRLLLAVITIFNLGSLACIVIIAQGGWLVSLIAIPMIMALVITFEAMRHAITSEA